MYDRTYTRKSNIGKKNDQRGWCLRHRCLEIRLLQCLQDLGRKSGLGKVHDGLRDELLASNDRNLARVPESFDLFVAPVLEVQTVLRDSNSCQQHPFYRDERRKGNGGTIIVTQALYLTWPLNS